MVQYRSESDRALAEAAGKRAGVDVTPWQVERWRQAGLIDPAERVWPGRGHGSCSRYGPLCIDQAAAVARLARRRRPLDQIALILFVRREPVPIAAVKAAYAALLNHVEKWLGDAATHADPELNVAAVRADQVLKYLLRTRQGRRMVGRLRRGVPGVPPREVLVSVLQNIFSILQSGDPASHEGLDELYMAGGLDAAGRDVAPGIPQPLDPHFPAGIPEVLSRMRLTDVRTGFAEATAEELVSARDDYLTLVEAFRGMATIAQVLWGLPDAFGLAAIADAPSDDLATAHILPVMLLLKKELAAPQAADLLLLLRERAAAFGTAGELLAGLPKSAQRRLRDRDPDALSDLSPTERDSFLGRASAVRLGDSGPADQ